MAKFRKRPVVIEAVQWLSRKVVCPPGPLWFAEAEERGDIQLTGDSLFIKTPEGEMRARPGDWIIRGVKGELYPCKADVFAATYEPAEPQAAQKAEPESQPEAELLVLVGLPRSGKTTLARALADKLGCPIVSPDSIRLAVHGRRFAAEAEPFVWAVAKAMVRALFLAGHRRVVLDATNTTRRRREEWRSPHWRRRFLVVRTPRGVCVERAVDQADGEILPVIERMAAGWEEVRPEEWDGGLEACAVSVLPEWLGRAEDLVEAVRWE